MAAVAPQIVTHGLKLKNGIYQPEGIRFVQPTLIQPFWMQTTRESFFYSQAYLDTVLAVRGAYIEVANAESPFSTLPIREGRSPFFEI